MKIAVDLDEVLGDFVGAFLKWRNRTYGGNWTYDDVVDYHWANYLGIPSEQAIDEVHQFFKTDEFADLPVIDGAREAVAVLARDHELVIVTARQHAIEGITRRWLEHNFSGQFREVIFANHYAKDGSPIKEKGELCREAGCDWIIEDNAYHLEPLMRYGVGVIIIDKPWNGHYRLPSQVRRASNWAEVVDIVKQLVRA